MKKRFTLGIAVLLLGSTAALAQYPGNNRGGEQQRSYDQQSQGQNSYSQYQGPAGNAREGDQNRQVYDTPRWSRGDRMPQEFAGSNHVSDWQNRHLRKPPRGYHWVRSGNEYVLAALANGRIASVVHSREQIR